PLLEGLERGPEPLREESGLAAREREARVRRDALGLRDLGARGGHEPRGLGSRFVATLHAEEGARHAERALRVLRSSIEGAALEDRAALVGREERLGVLEGALAVRGLHPVAGAATRRERVRELGCGARELLPARATRGVSDRGAERERERAVRRAAREVEG